MCETGEKEGEAQILTLREVFCSFGMVKIPTLRGHFRPIRVNFAEIVEILTLPENSQNS